MNDKRYQRRPSRQRTESGVVYCDRDLLNRVLSLVTSWHVLPYYLLAIGYSFWYARLESPPAQKFEVCVMRILPLVYLLELIRHSDGTVCESQRNYCRYIMLGLAVFIVGDFMLTWDMGLMTYSLSLFCVGLLLYAAAFYQYYKGATYAYLIIPFNIFTYGGLTYTFGTKLITLPLLSYMVTITVLGFYALARIEYFRTVPSYLGWAGVKLFMLVDFFLVCNETWPGDEVQFSGSVLTMTYYLAQLGIATSVFFC